MWTHDRVEIIPNDQGNRTTPSYVAFTDTERLCARPPCNDAFLVGCGCVRAPPYFLCATLKAPAFGTQRFVMYVIVIVIVMLLCCCYVPADVCARSGAGSATRPRTRSVRLADSVGLKLVHQHGPMPVRLVNW